MCGRFALTHSPAAIEEYFFTANTVPFAASYNIAPSQLIPVIAQHDRARRMMQLRWGLIPFWAKDASIGNRLINARVETIAEKPAFRQAFQLRRCIVPASGFYEWQDETRQPYYFHAANEDAPLAIAGIWDIWQASDHYIRSVALLTTAASAPVSTVHSRMPLLLRQADFERWLSPGVDEDLLKSLLRGDSGDALIARPVSRSVNNPAYNAPDCLQEVRDEA